MRTLLLQDDSGDIVGRLVVPGGDAALKPGLLVHLRASSGERCAVGRGGVVVLNDEYLQGLRESPSFRASVAAIRVDASSAEGPENPAVVTSTGRVS